MFRGLAKQGIGPTTIAMAEYYKQYVGKALKMPTTFEVI